MPRTCAVCRHEQRAAIDEALVKGTPLRTIADRWSVSKTALIRHRAHVPARLAKARHAKEIAQADSLLASIVTLRERLERALEGTAVAKDVASLARELRETLRLMLELEGRLRQGPQVQVNVALASSAEWIALQARIVQALGPFTDARQAVLAAIAGPGDVRTVPVLPARTAADSATPVPLVATTEDAGNVRNGADA